MITYITSSCHGHKGKGFQYTAVRVQVDTVARFECSLRVERKHGSGFVFLSVFLGTEYEVKSKSKDSFSVPQKLYW
jgi:hypothetical protein